MSNGFYDLVETFHLMSEKTLMELEDAEGLRTLLLRVRAAKKADFDCINYPRLKPSDDLTAVLTEL